MKRPDLLATCERIETLSLASEQKCAEFIATCERLDQESRKALADLRRIGAELQAALDNAVNQAIDLEADVDPNHYAEASHA